MRYYDMRKFYRRALFCMALLTVFTSIGSFAVGRVYERREAFVYDEGCNTDAECCEMYGNCGEF